MIREYLTPDFDITVYEIEDVITASGVIVGGDDPNPDTNEKWWG